MKASRPKPKRRATWILSLAAATACIVLFLSLGYCRQCLAPYSSIFLSTNPQVQLKLNRRGEAVGLNGLNTDGVTLLHGYQGKGKDKVTVADELVDRAIQMGFLSEGGMVSFDIDTPDNALFEQYGVELRTKMAEYGDGRLTITIEIHQRGETDQTPSSPSSIAPTNPSSFLSSSSPLPSNPDDDEGNKDKDEDDDDEDEEDGIKIFLLPPFWFGSVCNL